MAFTPKYIRAVLVFAILFANPLVCLAYQEQSLSIPNTYISSEPKSTFKLNAVSSDAVFAPSDVGIIGVKYLHRRGEMSNVIDVYPHTPAAAAGVRIGDQIIEVDHMNIMPFDADQVFSLIAGSPGEPVHLKLMRCDSNHGSYSACRPYEINLKRMDMNQLASDNVFHVYKYGQ
ncbi:MAG: PDZ domain-containing protein [Cyanobacteria bacterium]|nr:PDZ domain-containing protein [Cyanobacteriota bacterium]